MKKIIGQCLAMIMFSLVFVMVVYAICLDPLYVAIGVSIVIAAVSLVRVVVWLITGEA